MEETKRDWKKLVEESNGSLLFLPEKFLERAKEWQKKREELNKAALVAAELQTKANKMLEDLCFDLREYMVEAGRNDIWFKSIGFEDSALKDGDFIVSIFEPMGPGSR